MTDKTMRLNTLAPAEGSKKNRKRVGRGIGSGLGKTAGRGHKGQKSRSGGFHKVGFEGGQMPMHRRLPKRGFTAPFARFNEEVRLSDIERMSGDQIDMLALKQAGIVSELARAAKVILSGTLTRKVIISGVSVTAGAKAAIEALGGTVVAMPEPVKVRKLPSKAARAAAAQA